MEIPYILLISKIICVLIYIECLTSGYFIFHKHRKKSFKQCLLPYFFPGREL